MVNTSHHIDVQQALELLAFRPAPGAGFHPRRLFRRLRWGLCVHDNDLQHGNGRLCGKSAVSSRHMCAEHSPSLELENDRYSEVPSNVSEEQSESEL